jgi:predicted kinase
VVVDATFLRRGQRQAFQDLAARCGAGFGILAATAPWPVIEARIARRRAMGVDPSEADAAVARRQLEQIEPLSADEQKWVVQAEDPRLAPPIPQLPIPSLANR